MTVPKKYKLALVGTDSLQAQELKRALETQRFPVAGIEFFDPEVKEEFSKLTDFGDEPKVIHGLAEGALEGKDLVFLAADKTTNSRIAREAQKLAFRAVILGDALDGRGDVPPVVVGVNDDLLALTRPWVASSPHPVTVILSHLLKSIVARLGIVKAIAFVLQPASALGGSGIDELASQSVSLLSGAPLPTDVFKQQMAFNLLSHTEKPRSDGFSPTEKRLVSEVRRVLDRPDLPLSLSVVQASLFHTYAIMCYLELEKDIDIPGLEALWLESPYLKRTASDEPCSVSCISVTGKDEVFIGQIKKEGAIPRSFWVWAVADNLTRGSALNAIGIGRRLLGLGGAS